MIKELLTGNHLVEADDKSGGTAENKGVDEVHPRAGLPQNQKTKENEKPCQPHPVPEPGLFF